MLALHTLSSIVLAMAPGARQVVQAGPTGSMAVSADGKVALVDEQASTLYLYDLGSRTLVRSIPGSVLNGDAGLVHPIIPTWDDVTHEVVLPRGSDALGIDIEGKLTPRPMQATRIWPIGGGGKARWATRQYGDAEVRDATGQLLGKLVKSESIAAAANGKLVLVGAKEGLLRFTIDLAKGPVGAPYPIAMPAPIDQPLSGRPIAVSSDGETAVVCLKGPRGHQAAIVRGITMTPAVKLIDFTGGMIGCEVAIAEALGIVVVGTTGEIRGFDLKTGALRWQAPREFGVQSPAASQLAIAGRTVVISWKGLVLLDVQRGDVVGQIGAEIARPEQLWMLKGDQLLTSRRQATSIFGPSGVELATWSLKDGTRVQTGSASWGLRSRVAEDGSLWTVRTVAPGAPGPDACWTFSRGTTADGAPEKAPAKNSWPPKPGKSAATCVDGKAGSVVGADLATGALVTFDYKAGTIVVPHTGKPVTLENAPKAAMEISFSPDGAWAFGANLFGSWGSLHAWDVKTGKRRWFTGSASDGEGIPIGGGTRSGYSAHAVSADAQRIVVAGSSSMTIYALATKKPISTVTVTGSVSAVAFGPGDLVVAGTGDGQLITWRGSKVTATASDGGAIAQLVVRSDGRRAATISDDGAVRIWDLAKPALLATLVETTDGEAYASTPGGAYAGGREAADQLAWVFDGPAEGFKFERFSAVLAHPEIVAKRLADATTDLTATIVRPPHVAIVQQPPPSGTSVKLAVRVDGPSVVRELRVFVNGRPASTTPVGKPSAELSIDVALEAGSNAITVIAFDDQGRASNPVTTDVATAPAPGRPDIWVVAAGVGWYPNLPEKDQLEGSVNDAYAIADAFAAQAGPNKRYDKPHITVLEDEQVSADAVEKAIAGLAAMKPNDVAIVFLAGHGVRLPKTADMVLLTGTAKLDKATWASSGIGWNRIGGALAKAKGRVLVLLDACHAGNVTQELIVPNTQLADDLVAAQRAGVLVFAASKGSQRSLKENAARQIVLDDDQKILVKHKRTPKQPPPPAPPPAQATAKRERRGNGFFTGAVIAAIDSPVTDINHDSSIQTAELITQVQLRVIRASRGKQTPWVARRELFGDFAITTAAK